MTSFYALYSHRELQRCITGYPRLDISFLDGQPLDISVLESPLRVTGTFDAEAPPTHFETGQIPIFSDSLIETFKAAGVDNFQSIPVIITGMDNTEWSGFQAVQVIGTLACCDLDETEHTVIAEGDGDQIPKLISAVRVRIDADKVPGNLHLFRLAEDPSHMIVSEQVVAAIDKNRPEKGWGIIISPVTP